MNRISKRDALLRGLKGQRKKKLTRTVFLLLLAVFVWFILYVGVILVLKTPSPMHTPISRSMEPTLKIGDLLILQGGLSAMDIYASPGDGDIIIFRDPRNPDGIPIVHRAVDKYQIDDVWYIVTWGDNNPSPDNWYMYFPSGGIYSKAGVSDEYLLGKVIIVIPYFGYFEILKITVGSYEIPLRVFLIAILIGAFLFLEYTDQKENVKELYRNEDSHNDESIAKPLNTDSNMESL